MKKLNTRQIALNGIVAGLYAAITILTASFAYGNIQFRISEALMMLLLFEPHLTIGLTIGCLIANLFSTVSVLDIVIGTAATLLACLLTTRIKKPWLAPLPTILVNSSGTACSSSAARSARAKLPYSMCSASRSITP